jgi:two-component system OmpR family response regulator
VTVGSTTGVIDRIDPAQPERRKNRVLVIDEEVPLTDLLTLSLTFEGWEVETLANGNEAVAVARRFRPDAILLDMMLPDVSGVAVVTRLRESGIATPVIFLTGRTSLEDRLAAFGAGGDDYMTKPFGLEEVSTRLRAVFRRAGLADTSLVFGDLVVDDASGQVWRGGEPVMLSSLEVRLLKVLIDRAGDPIDGTGLIRILGLSGHSVIDSAATRAVESLQEKINADAAPLVQLSDGAAWLVAPADGARS